MRDCNERVLDAFAINLGACSITRAELTGAVVGIQRAWDLGIRNLEVPVDSRCAVQLLSNEGSQEHQHAGIIRHFKDLQSRQWDVWITHIYQEGNHLADHLSGKGRELGLGCHTIPNSDPNLQYWARYDNVGGSETRVIVTS
ncbi:Putative ribonuclease H protein At1g65750 [Linum perenne]